MLPQGRYKWACVQEASFPIKLTTLHLVAKLPSLAARDRVCPMAAQNEIALVRYLALLGLVGKGPCSMAGLEA